MEQQKFIEMVKNGAIEGWNKYNVLPSITIAQAILESGWGESELAKKANNLFGIKAKSDWNGSRYNIKTAEYDKNNKKFYINADFRAYNNWNESILDHSNFFTENEWRKNNYKSFVGQKDYKIAAKKLQECGYATSQSYANSLIEIIERYKLYEYDLVACENKEKGGNKMRIFLSVGHSILRGGGCTSASGYVNEYRYNKELALYVKKELEVLGHQCDVIVCPENRFSNWKEERTYKLPIANSGRYDLVCELHLNASNGQGHGMECLYYGNDSKGRAIASRACSLFSKLGFKDRGSKSRSDLYILAQTKPTAVLFESFFCDNKGDCDLAHKIGFKNIASNIAAALVGSEVKVYSNNSNNSKPTQKEGNYFVLTNTPNDVLNVREQPTVKSSIKSSYRHRSKIYVHEAVKNSEGTWYRIEYKKGCFGFVSAKYCIGIR